MVCLHTERKRVPPQFRPVVISRQKKTRSPCGGGRGGRSHREAKKKKSPPRTRRDGQGGPVPVTHRGRGVTALGTAQSPTDRPAACGHPLGRLLGGPNPAKLRKETRIRFRYRGWLFPPARYWAYPALPMLPFSLYSPSQKRTRALSLPGEGYLEAELRFCRRFRHFLASGNFRYCQLAKPVAKG